MFWGTNKKENNKKRKNKLQKNTEIVNVQILVLTGTTTASTSSAVRTFFKLRRISEEISLLSFPSFLSLLPLSLSYTLSISFLLNFLLLLLLLFLLIFLFRLIRLGALCKYDSTHGRNVYPSSSAAALGETISSNIMEGKEKERRGDEMIVKEREINIIMMTVTIIRKSKIIK